MLLAIFLVSVLALEAILRHDEVMERKLKKAPAPQTLPDSPSPDSAGVLILAQAIEQHSRDAKRPTRSPQPASAVSSLDSSLQEAQGR